MKIKCFDKDGKEYAFEESEYVYRKSVYGFVENNGEVLLIVDSRGSSWEIPGGGIDEGEDEQQALEREMFEETGLKVDTSEMIFIDQIVGYFYSIGTQTPLKTDRVYYKIKLSKHPGKLITGGNGDDVIKAEFVEIKKALKLKNFAPVDFKILKKTISN